MSAREPAAGRTEGFVVAVTGDPQVSRVRVLDDMPRRHHVLASVDVGREAGRGRAPGPQLERPLVYLGRDHESLLYCLIEAKALGAAGSTLSIVASRGHGVRGLVGEGRTARLQ